MSSDPILEHYPFLIYLPEEILKELDLNVLMLPSFRQREKIRELEEKTQSFVALYKKGYVAKGKHLCKTIRSAQLDPDALELIFQWEKKIQKENETVLVAYHKPILYFDAYVF
ncbi:hypothetical protein A0128_15115 [Leptospira tipperaryensis]|uniref:Uncharacterized protein n=1 Tax=Leptospira tipperaryensis TaxID=2564040 RepID=A0A1D7UZQ5_9LEPT|nr:hypothetical protein [Leptospira tipperaryensis]AOP35057.1 hypothetical protein A0128_15115 [Leptospira tipperaryensis]